MSYSVSNRTESSRLENYKDTHYISAAKGEWSKNEFR